MSTPAGGPYVPPYYPGGPAGASGKGMGAGKVLAIVIGGVLLFFLAVGGFILSVMSGLRNSDATRSAVHVAEGNPQVVAVTGTPLKAERLVSGHVNLDGSGGEATLTIPVSGPRGKGSLYSVEIRQGGVWTQQTLEFWPESDPNAAIRVVEPSTSVPTQP